MKQHELKEISLSEIQLRLEDLEEEMNNLRYQKALGQLNNPLRIRIVRREIAQLKTIIHECELGLRVLAGEKEKEKEKEEEHGK